MKKKNIIYILIIIAAVMLTISVFTGYLEKYTEILNLKEYANHTQYCEKDYVKAAYRCQDGSVKVELFLVKEGIRVKKLDGVELICPGVITEATSETVKEACIPYLTRGYCSEDDLCKKDYPSKPSESDKTLAENFIRTTEEYVGYSGTNLRLIEVQRADCAECWTLFYKFDIDPSKNPDIEETITAIVGIANGELSGVAVKAVDK